MSDTPVSTGKPHILVIDDDPDMHLAIEAILSGAGYDVTCCRTGAEGLEQMRRTRPDLLLLDIMLAQPTEGIQVACQMRQDPHLKHIPIVFVSAMGEGSETEYAREVCPVALDADLFLEKPLHAASVREAVQWVLQQKGRDTGAPGPRAEPTTGL
jgi:CheY-like chemotaxis protein